MSTLKKMVETAYEHNRFFDATVWAEEKGAGKTVFSWLTAATVYGSFAESYKYIYFHPLDALYLFKNLMRENKKIPIIVMDDAGLHLGARAWYEAERKAFTEFYNVIRQVCACVLFTSPRVTDILKGIRDQINYSVKIYTVRGGLYQREARIYTKYQSPILRNVIEKTATDEFNLKQMPMDWYQKYEEQKNKHTADKIEGAIDMYENLGKKKQATIKDVVTKNKFSELCMSYGITRAIARTLYDELKEGVEHEEEEPQTH